MSFYNAMLDEAFGGAVKKSEPSSPDLFSEGVASLKSPLANVSDEQWTRFVKATAVAKVDAVSDSNALGMFELMPRRLADFGLVSKLTRTCSAKGRTIWTATFVPPLTCAKFLKSSQAQYKVFVASIKQYAGRIADGVIAKDADTSLSGALAILHRAGPSGLRTWKTGKRFAKTQEVYDRAAGIF